MKTKNLLFVFTIGLIGLLFNASLLAQVQNPVSDIFPPSPNAASLGFFAKNNVSLHTGAPNVEIPLYEVKIGNLNVPISLSYNSTGIKPNEKTSWVGMGWALNAGGVVTRETRYHPDEWIGVGFFANSDAIFNIGPKDNVFESYTDYEPDIFYFNFGKYSGKFYASNDKDVNGNPVFYSVPNYNFRINCNIENSGAIGTINQITITTDDGTQYIFGDATAVFYDNKGYSHQDLPVEYTQKVNPTPNDGFDRAPVTTSWYLAKIISPNESQDITFNYKATDGTKSYCSEEYFSYTWSESLSLPKSTGLWASGVSGNIKLVENKSIVWRRYLSSIETSDEKIDFTFSNNSFLLYKNTYTNTDPTINNYDQKLDEIVITNKKTGNTTIKDISFCYDNSNFRLTLDAINLKAGNEVNSYNFSYNNIYALPVKKTDKFDHWGYLISPEGYSLCNITRVLQPIVCMGDSNVEHRVSSNRGPDLSLTGIGMLNKITYPTGGIVSFEYEQNTYNAYLQRTNLGSYGNTNKGYDYKQLSTFGYAGGCRVKRIIENDGKGNNVIKNYTYFSGILSELPTYSYSDKGTSYWIDAGMSTTEPLTYVVRQNIPINSFSYTSGSSICYSRVVETLGDGSNTETIFTNFDNHCDILEGYFFNRYIKDKDGNIYIANPVFPFLSPVTPRDVERGKILRINYHDKNNNLVKQTDYGYTNKCTSVIDDIDHLNLPETGTYNALAVKSVRCLRKGSSMPKQNLVPPINEQNPGITISSDFLCSYMLPYYPYITSYETTKTYPGPVTVREDYTYTDDKYINLSGKSTTGSDGKVKIVNYTYPTDNVNYSSQLFKEMVDNKNIISPIVSTTTLVNNTMVSGTNKEFYGSDNDYLPKLEKRWNSVTKIYDTIINYDNYNDKGFLREFHKENDSHTTILYAYNNNLPIAKIENTKLTDITSTLSDSWLTSLGTSYNDADILPKINSLRSTFPTKLIQSYLYNINYRAISAEYPYSNNRITYDYDNWGRLVMVKDHNEKVSKSYKYKIIGTTSTSTCPSYNQTATAIEYDIIPPQKVEICKVTQVNNDGTETELNSLTITVGSKYRVYFKSSYPDNGQRYYLYLHSYYDNYNTSLYNTSASSSRDAQYIEWSPIDCYFGTLKTSMQCCFQIRNPNVLSDDVTDDYISNNSDLYFRIDNCK